jgi:hypothetical protein
LPGLFQRFDQIDTYILFAIAAADR